MKTKQKKQKKQKQRIEVVLETFVAGVIYSDFDINRGRLRKGERLTLRNEPFNIHDPRAIAVYWKQTRIGYIPRLLTQFIHGNLCPLRCEVVNFSRTNPTHRMILVRISRLVQTELPFDIPSF